MARPDSTTRVGSEQFGLGFALYGFRDIERALKIFAPELAKQMDREIKGALEPLVVAARGHVPTEALSGWGAEGSGAWSTRLGYDPAAIVRGIKIRKGGGTSAAARRLGARTAYRVVNQNPAGAVLELAGRKSSSAFTRALEQRHGRASRLIWRAWDESGGKDRIEEKILDAVDSAERQLQRLADQAGGG